jgi:uncharacterized protein YndB with AHSA1/START domain
MPVKKDPSGRRSVDAEVEVPGTPEEVWQAIASGAGISAWFVPTEIEERVGGNAVSHFGPGNSMDSVAKITAWDPPRRYTAETQEGPGPIATEWTVTARAGGTCTVRVVHSWFASSDEWDAQFEGHQEGWQAMFRTLRLYLTRFRGMTGESIPLMGIVKKSKLEAWSALTAALGIGPTAAGQHLTISGEAPLLAGVVERVGEDGHLHELMLRLDAPAPGIAHFACAAQAGDQVFVVIRLYFYGEQAAATAARDAPRWQAWMQARFPFAPKS